MATLRQECPDVCGLVSQWKLAATFPIKVRVVTHLCILSADPLLHPRGPWQMNEVG